MYIFIHSPFTAPANTASKSAKCRIGEETEATEGDVRTDA
jgi:hypothetical protein